MTNHTYLTTTNYWAPLHDDTEEININKEILRRPSQKEVFKNYYFDKNGLPSSMKNQHMPTLQKGEEDEDGILS